MRGIDSTTGKAISGLAHLRQSIRDILTTPIGSRVMRREYGSRLFSLIDAPINRATIVQIYSATVEALMRWEPRISVTKVEVAQVSAGKISLNLEAKDISTGELVLIDGLVL